MTRFSAPISEQIWDMKYRFKDNDGTIIDQTVEDTWTRIATALANAEENPIDHIHEFYEAVEDFKFLPAGRIIAGAGTGRMVTLFNCYVMGTVPDSMGGIFDMLKEAALTMQQGGGIGYDFSTLRPKGAPVKKLGADASGPLTFMDCWDSMCRTVMSAGSRRGAMMATMRCDHPDVFDFITAKQDAARLRMFNMSVLITIPFMEALARNADWDLVFNGKVYRTVKAQDLWDAIMRSTYDYAEPGVIFIDRINATNNLNYCETIAATNPCGEQPLPHTVLVSLVRLTWRKMVVNPFENNTTIDGDLLRATVTQAIRMMDNVVDVSNFPLPNRQPKPKPSVVLVSDTRASPTCSSCWVIPMAPMKPWTSWKPWPTTSNWLPIMPLSIWRKKRVHSPCSTPTSFWPPAPMLTSSVRRTQTLSLRSAPMVSETAT
jgi:ribonucleoside-diphosphate reductase alpha chain